MKKLAELTTTEFSDLLASDAPAPGGGSAAALEGALGAALSAMVCNLTTAGKNKEKYADSQELASSGAKKAAELKDRFIDVMDRDTEAFNAVSAAFGMPKGTPEEKAARSAAIQRGLEGCTKTPFEMMQLAVETLELTSSLVGKTNTSAASDLGVSALSLRAAIQGAWLNVLINIGSLKNKELADDYRQKGEALLAKALPLADEIYEKILAMM
ncbi:MAG: cyclodeaminase/cyclohydrolase family protein [Eubacterium sp.]|jgi:formiminotetrahydrofolate cyclodeaminase